jgi:hypothetical protein
MEQIEKLKPLIQAMRALNKSLERSINMNGGQGTGKMSVKSYRSLHQRITELMPDDFYIAETLALDETEGDDVTLSNQVMLASNQLLIYLDDITKDQQKNFIDARGIPLDMGRDIGDQIIN